MAGGATSRSGAGATCGPPRSDSRSCATTTAPSTSPGIDRSGRARTRRTPDHPAPYPVDHRRGHRHVRHPLVEVRGVSATSLETRWPRAPRRTRSRRRSAISAVDPTHQVHRIDRTETMPVTSARSGAARCVVLTTSRCRGATLGARQTRRSPKSRIPARRRTAPAGDSWARPSPRTGRHLVPHPVVFLRLPAEPQRSGEQ